MDDVDVKGVGEACETPFAGEVPAERVEFAGESERKGMRVRESELVKGESRARREGRLGSNEYLGLVPQHCAFLARPVSTNGLDKYNLAKFFTCIQSNHLKTGTCINAWKEDWVDGLGPS